MDINKPSLHNSDTEYVYQDEGIRDMQQREKGYFAALLPLKSVVILPKSIIPIIVGRPSSIQAVEFALKNDKTLFITAQKDSRVESPTVHDVFEYGTRSTILQVIRMPNGSLKILAEGICRARIVKEESPESFIGVYCDDIATSGTENTVEIEAVWRQLRTLYASYAKLDEKVSADLSLVAKTMEDIDYIVDTIAVHVNKLSFEDRQTILETADLRERMLKLCDMLTKEIEILQVEQRIRGRIQNQVEKNQREYYLTEQMKAIQKELGNEDQGSEIEMMRAKVKTLGLPAEVLEKTEKELKRLEQMPPMSSEAVVSRHYVDWIISLPWKKQSKDTISIAQAEKMLNKNHAGMVKAKERITEFVAAKKFSENLERSPILCLAGPPGVGKTSIVKSIADSLGREFIRISLGGVKDEAEIRGHRRTYIGALPGKILQAMKKAKTINPVILLDEIDKMSRDVHGDPASALLEVLDPEQNKGFKDHFLDVEYDLSRVMFIATANSVDGIPYPLYDRMEIIPLSGYTEDEKVGIARQFLIPKNLKEYSLTAKQCKMDDEIVRYLALYYTKEAGVRQLERVIATLMRKTIQQILKSDKTKTVMITQELIKEWLGNQKFKKTSLDSAANRVGLATGLAWTEVGGDVLEIETSVLPGKGGLTLTGQLGEVMQESAQAALSYLRARATELGLQRSFHTRHDIHLHIPEGATPKDGPSAGITIATALVSALTKIPTKHHLAMTGEITLRGRVLGVGGLKEKLLAAKQHQCTTVIVPQENEDEIQDILKEMTLTDVDIVFVRTMDEVLNVVFESNPIHKAKAADTQKAKSKKRMPVKKGKKKAASQSAA